MTPSLLLDEYRESFALVQIEREEIDPNSLDGFILYHDEEWVMLLKEEDFRLNGVVFIRKQDITSLKSGKTQAFHKQIMEQEGELNSYNPLDKIPSVGIPEFLSCLPKHKVVIFEEETEDEDMFYIGLIEKIEDMQVHLKSFSTEAVIDEETTIVELEHITSISHDTSYTLAYEQHFQRSQRKASFPQLSQKSLAVLSWLMLSAAMASLIFRWQLGNSVTFAIVYSCFFASMMLRRKFPTPIRTHYAELAAALLVPALVVGFALCAENNRSGLWLAIPAAITFLSSLIYLDTKQLWPRKPVKAD
ncbi:hypothetical protein Rhal01_02036 [Rubritalea halochordaticola]|uniref:Uncharacterized protein n=1 Tax=Rubritalea halochordaticola TaxID=714537 RepID=A0ABP9UZI5_9BACT